jgi:hypothetical protein
MWILYILVVAVSGVSQQTIPFNDEAACRKAQQELNQVLNTVQIQPRPVVLQSCWGLSVRSP